MSGRKKKKPEPAIKDVVAKLRMTYGGGPNLWPPHIAFLVQRVEECESDAEEFNGTLTRLMELLKDIAIALKGPEPALVMHDWSDLPELAEKKMERIAFLEKRLKGAR